MKNFIFTLSVLVGSPFSFFSQIKGKVITRTFTGEIKPLQKVKLKANSIDFPLETNELGVFEFVLKAPYIDTLIFSKIGYETDTVFLTAADRFTGLSIELLTVKQLQEATVSTQRLNKHIDRLNPILVERLGVKELRKAACCNLSESFETNTTADVTNTDAVSGTRKIQLLGLDGNYTHFQLENRTIINGLARANGLLVLPGTWLSGIEISKGGGSVTTSHSALTGSINVNLIPVSQLKQFSYNAYINSLGRSELNFMGKIQLKPKWNFSHFQHVSGLWTEHDGNKDGFRDTPLTETISLIHRFNYQGERLESQFGWEIYQDKRKGGQMNRFSNPYSVKLENRHLGIFAKTGFLFPKHPEQSLGIIYHFKLHESGLQFGTNNVSGNEINGAITSLYSMELGSPVHSLTSGIELEGNQTKVSFNNLQLPVNYTKISGYSEYTFQGTRFTAVTGARLDKLNAIQPLVTPRLQLKYLLTEQSTLRFTTGRTWRLPFWVTDNQGLLATSKQWILPQSLQPEIAWNSGIALTIDKKLKGKPIQLTTDLYLVQFERQLIIDREIDKNAFIFNYQKNTTSWVHQTEINFTPKQRLELRVAYKYVRATAHYDGKIQQQLFTAKHRFLANVAYKTRNKKWDFDLTGSINSGMRLPENLSHEKVVMPQVIGQISYNFKKSALYLGSENMTNYRQPHPIQSASNPFGPTFDATTIYGSILGTIIYLGFRADI